jgi:acyl dehydratase
LQSRESGFIGTDLEDDLEITVGLNFQNIGRPLEPTSYTYTQDDVILYALSIGAGVDGELDFVYEKNLKVFPTFCVVPPSVEVTGWHQMAGISLRHLLQVGHRMEFFAPIPASGTVYTTATYHPVYDRGDSGALIHMTGETKDGNGRLLFINRCTLLDRSAGHFGGTPGSVEQKLSPPEGEKADFQVTYATSPNQAAWYRLSGDKNPMHIDPDFARLGGFRRPILHGLCTFGFAGRAILHQLCQSNPGRLRSISAHFAGVVYPGETLVIMGWRLRFNSWVFQARTGDGRLTLDSGLTEIE